MTDEAAEKPVAPPRVPTEQEAQDAADKVMDPKLLSRKTTFLGREVTVRPLPILWSKRINSRLNPVSEQIRKFSDKWKDGGPEAFTADLGQENLDDDIAMAYLDVVGILAEFYGIEMTQDQINEELDLGSAEAFVSLQLEVCGESDFLLRPLAAITKLFQILKTMDQAASQIMQSTSAFVKDGGLIPPGLSESTPTDS